MVIGFLIALFLAWPTFGLSFVAYFVIIAANGYLKGKRLKQISDERDARQAIAEGRSGDFPSWYRNTNEVEIFLKIVGQMANKKGVPSVHVDALLNKGDFLRLLMELAAEMERSGNSKIAQQMGATNLMVDFYQNMSARDIARLMY